MIVNYGSFNCFGALWAQSLGLSPRTWITRYFLGRYFFLWPWRGRSIARWWTKLRGSFLSHRWVTGVAEPYRWYLLTFPEGPLSPLHHLDCRLCIVLTGVIMSPQYLTMTLKIWCEQGRILLGLLLSMVIEPCRWYYHPSPKRPHLCLRLVVHVFLVAGQCLVPLTFLLNGVGGGGLSQFLRVFKKYELYECMLTSYLCASHLYISMLKPNLWTTFVNMLRSDSWIMYYMC